MRQTDIKLQELGSRLRLERLQRNETQAIFSARIGVSIPTLRKMEAGDTTVMVGSWSRALDIVGRSDDWDGLLHQEENLFDKYNRLSPSPSRRRASRRTQ